MFDLSFFEIIIIALVALIVIGPEKLPAVAKTLGNLTGRAQRFIAKIKEEVGREARFEELQSLQDEMAAGASKAKASLQSEAEVIEAAFSDSKTKQEDTNNKPKQSKKESDQSSVDQST